MTAMTGGGTLRVDPTAVLVDEFGGNGPMNEAAWIAVNFRRVHNTAAALSTGDALLTSVEAWPAAGRTFEAEALPMPPGSHAALVVQSAEGGSEASLSLTHGGDLVSALTGDTEDMPSPAVPHDPVAHRYLRLIERRGTLAWEAARFRPGPWATLRVAPTPRWATSVRLILRARGVPGEIV